MSEEEKHQRRVRGRLRAYLTRRRSPRTILSAILVLTAMAGFVTSFAMLKLGLSSMWLRYPLAVLGAWAFFLLLVRSWAHSEREYIRLDEDLSDLEPADEVVGRSSSSSPTWDRKPTGCLDCLDLGSVFEIEGGCLVGLAVLVVIIAFGGVVVAFAGLIMQAEVVLAEVLLDLVLVSALNRRLRHLQPEWWMAGALRQTVWPVLAATAFLMAAGFLMHLYAPEAESIGAVWRHWRGPQ
jgi:hypothetical protein